MSSTLPPSSADAAARTPLKLQNYTLQGDVGLVKVNVDEPSGDDIAARYLPLQWAIDSSFMSMTTGTTPAKPYSWEYTNLTQQDIDERNRLGTFDSTLTRLGESSLIK